MSEDGRERKSLETELQQARKMEVIGQLTGGVAHDFSNLLTVIAGFAELALSGESPAQEALEQILIATERASGLTRRLLTFSRPQELEARVFDVNQLVRDIETMIRRLIGENIDVLAEISETPLTVKASPSHIEQVILNLAINSRDAMPHGGKLVLSTSKQGEHCAITIKDTGCGIPSGILPRVFEPFFTTKPEGKGTGLGLSTALEIVRESGGSIAVISEPDAGTTMTVLLPQCSEQAEARVSVAGTRIGTGRETVLVAEDDDIVLRLVSHGLKACGFTVLQAKNGEDAIDLLHAQGPAGVDLLISDIVMPGMAGPMLAARATELLPQLKVLFMSGYTEDVISTYGISPANLDFIQKPFTPRELVKKVRTLLDSHDDVSSPAA